MNYKKYIALLPGLIKANINIKCKKIQSSGIKHYFGRKSKLISLSGGSIKVGDKLYLSDNTTISAEHAGTIFIGTNNFFNTNCKVVGLHQIRIGNDNLFGQNVVIVDHNHNYNDIKIPICKQGYKYGNIIIGNGNWICANVVICAGSEIGDHVVVAANSVVKGKLESNCIYAGSPAKLIKRIGDGTSIMVHQ